VILNNNRLKIELIEMKTLGIVLLTTITLGSSLGQDNVIMGDGNVVKGFANVIKG
jgi:hypothetical protein